MTNKDLLKILFVEDVPSDAELAVLELRKEKLQFEYIRVDKRDKFIKTLNDFMPDIVISDYKMPSYNGMQALNDAHEFDPLLPFILCTGSQNEEIAVKCIKEGADDYILKDNLSRLGQAVVNSISKGRLLKEKKDAETALRGSEEKYRHIFENVQDLYYETSIDGMILELSPSVEILTKGQYRREDLIGKPMSEFYSDMYERQSLLTKLKEHGSVFDFEITLKNRDGSLILCSVSAKLSLDAQGRPEKIIGSIHDITPRKRVEEELIKAKNKAEESDRLKTAFLHNISHEIRTPMNAIVGFSAILGEPDIDQPTQQLCIETITQSSNQLLAIISDIVDISNIEADLVKTVKTVIDVNITFDNICNQFLPKAGEKKIKLLWESELSGSDALIFTDKTKLTQILSNLMNNALKFTHEGSVKAKCKKTDNFLEFSVSDTGIGIPAEHHARIFDRFYQVQHELSRLNEGTGLGLAISKAYVELLGGKIWLSSELGKGTTFTFTIPYEKQTVAPLPVIEKSGYKEFVFPVKKTILVAEDIDSNFRLIQYFLSGANTKIIRASNGKEVVELALTVKEINLILMDIRMPEMDGYSATRLIREANITIPIIAQTAYTDDRMKAIQSGCSGFISKPFDKNSLLKVISGYI